MRSNNENNEQYVVIGSHKRFAKIQLYKLKESPYKDFAFVHPESDAKLEDDFALLGKQTRFADSLPYKLKPIIHTLDTATSTNEGLLESRNAAIQTEQDDTSGEKLNQTEADKALLANSPEKPVPSNNAVNKPHHTGNEKNVDTPASDETKSKKVNQPINKSRYYQTEYQANFSDNKIGSQQCRADSKKKRQTSRKKFGNAEVFPSSRWKSEYMAKFKPFWKYEIVGGRLVKNDHFNEPGYINPNTPLLKVLEENERKAQEMRRKVRGDHLISNFYQKMKKPGNALLDISNSTDDNDVSRALPPKAYENNLRNVRSDNTLQDAELSFKDLNDIHISNTRSLASLIADKNRSSNAVYKSLRWSDELKKPKKNRRFTSRDIYADGTDSNESIYYSTENPRTKNCDNCRAPFKSAKPILKTRHSNFYLYKEDKAPVKDMNSVSPSVSETNSVGSKCSLASEVVRRANSKGN